MVSHFIFNNLYQFLIPSCMEFNSFRVWPFIIFFKSLCMVSFSTFAKLYYHAWYVIYYLARFIYSRPAGRQVPVDGQSNFCCSLMDRFPKWEPSGATNKVCCVLGRGSNGTSTDLGGEDKRWGNPGPWVKILPQTYASHRNKELDMDKKIIYSVPNITSARKGKEQQ